MLTSAVWDRKAVLQQWGMGPYAYGIPWPTAVALLTLDNFLVARWLTSVVLVSLGLLTRFGLVG